MSFQYSTGFKNAVLKNQSVKEIFETMIIQLYASTSTPGTPDEAATGTVLVEFSAEGVTDAPLDLAADPVGGLIEKLSTQSWSGTAGAAGTALYFRAVVPTDDQSVVSTTQKRIQGSVGTTAGALRMSSTDIILGDTYTLDYFTIEFLGG